ncbi:DUF6881 domain-containing protein [Paenibacillus lutimineralis]|uniref:DUF6881 domain-containing protein n=1 Tax=Paenibacillus lutimineralis TaxID=2707005 RepID=A0A3Q9I6S7_9BACL|nr:hypothetical protein [Paenibacillus lutimineralis]AZS13828.1 hypothetical protein EI981_04755 [Paenibacillus lutimineralis]
MKYLKCKWIHDFMNEPTIIISEIDENRFETRKIEIFRDGKFGLAALNLEYMNTRLGEVPLPDMDEQFEVQSISSQEFNEMWRDKIQSFIRLLKD